jgi:hypothetical protein
MSRYSPEQKEQILEEIENLFGPRPPLEIRETILEFQQVYLIHQSEALPVDFEQMSENFYLLSEFLKRLDKIIKGDPTDDPG